MSNRFLCVVLGCLALIGAPVFQAPAASSAWAQPVPEYDPLLVPAGFKPTYHDLTVVDAERSREIPIRVYLPSTTQPAPVVVFSHGLGGARTNNVYMGNHWSARGMVAVFLQHPGSDESVWKDAGLGKRWKAMNDAASGQNLQLRAKDVPVVLDQLEVWNREKGHLLFGRLDMTRVGMSGHSFGAQTTQAVAGQFFPIMGQCFTLPGLRAAIMFSPSSPKLGSASKAFGQVKIPWLLMTGTRDVARIGGATLESRLAVFPALTPGGKYELVLFNAEHYAFSEREGAGIGAPRPPSPPRAILALTAAFWEAYLADNPQARAWLDGSGPTSILESQDRWQKK